MLDDPLLVAVVAGASVIMAVSAYYIYTLWQELREVHFGE